MEAIGIALLGQVVLPLAGAAISIAVGLAVKYLKGKIRFEEGKQALDALDNIVSTTVGNIAQTTKKDLLRESKKAKLSGAQAVDVKRAALARIKAVASDEIQAAASRMVTDLDGYVEQKIEDSVLRLKK